MNKAKPLLVSGAIVCVLAGCAAAPVTEKASDVARSSLGKTPLSWSAVKKSAGSVNVGWIAAYNDPVLVKLVQEAQRNNHNLQAAGANVDKARILAQQAGAASSPTLSLQAGAQRSGTPNAGAKTSLNLGLKTNWEADVWGRIAAGEQVAQASLESAQADYRFSQYSLAAGVARSYFSAIAANQQEQIAQNNVDLVKQVKKIVDSQFRNGIAAGADVALVKADLASATENLVAAQGGTRDAIRGLELLLGRYPGAELKVSNAMPEAPEPPSVGVPSSILERRPDLIAAERRIASAIGSVAVAKAARLPKISLTGSLGGSSNELSSLLKPSNLIWSLASNLLVPLVDGGAGKAQVDIKTAEQKAAVAAYADAALKAFGEVEQALDQRLTLEKRRAALNEAHKQSTETLRLAKLLFKEGEGELIDVLNIQQRVNGSRNQLLSVRSAQLQQYLDLNLALGGDWRSP